MKLTLNGVDIAKAKWKREPRPHNVYPPPDDGREWILIDEAAKLFGIKPSSMCNKARHLDFTRTARPGVKPWLLKSEVISYLAFTKDRDQWHKRHRPKCWKPVHGSYEGETDEYMQRVFWTSKQAAAFMGVHVSTITYWARCGRIPAFYNRKTGKGCKHWYSPTSLRNFKEDEEYLKRRAIYEKGNAALRTGSVGREVYKQKHNPRVYKKPIPEGWLTIREAAELLGMSLQCVYALRRRGRIVSEQFTGKWDAKGRPWFILQVSLEQYTQTEDYRRKHRQGVEWAQKRADIYVSDSAPVTVAKQYEPHPADEQATLGCHYDVVTNVKEERMSMCILQTCGKPNARKAGMPFQSKHCRNVAECCIIILHPSPEGSLQHITNPWDLSPRRQTLLSSERG